MSKKKQGMVQPNAAFSLSDFSSEPTIAVGICMTNLRLSEKEYQLLGNDLKSSIREAIMKTMVDSGWDKDETLVFQFTSSYPQDENILH